MRAIVLLAALMSCEQRMADQPRLDPMEESQTFPDGQADRPPVPGTVSREATLEAVPDELPRPVTMATLERGKDRFEIFCTPCHGLTGEGDGMVVQRGFPSPPSYLDPRLKAAPDRHFYEVITNGYGVMYSYADRVPPADRWAIVAYIRALQLAGGAPVAELSPDLRERLKE